MAKTRRQNRKQDSIPNKIKQMLRENDIGIGFYTMLISIIIAKYAFINSQNDLVAQNTIGDLDRTLTIEAFTRYYWTAKIMSALKKLLGTYMVILDVPFEIGKEGEGDESYIVTENGNLKAKIASNFIKSFPDGTNPKVIEQLNPGEISCPLYNNSTKEILAICIFKPYIFYEYDAENIFEIKNIKPVIKLVLYAKNSQVKGKDLGSVYFKIFTQIFGSIRFTYTEKIDKIATKIYKQLYPQNYESLVKLNRIKEFVFSAAGKFAKNFWENQGAIPTNFFDSQVLNSQIDPNMFPMVFDLLTQIPDYNPPDANDGSSTQVMYGNNPSEIVAPHPNMGVKNNSLNPYSNVGNSQKSQRVKPNVLKIKTKPNVPKSRKNIKADSSSTRRDEETQKYGAIAPNSNEKTTQPLYEAVAQNSNSNEDTQIAVAQNSNSNEDTQIAVALPVVDNSSQHKKKGIKPVNNSIQDNVDLTINKDVENKSLLNNGKRKYDEPPSDKPPSNENKTKIIMTLLGPRAVTPDMRNIPIYDISEKIAKKIGEGNYYQNYGKIPYYGGSKYTRKIKRPLK